MSSLLLHFMWAFALSTGALAIDYGLDIGGLYGILVVSAGMLAILQVGKSMERNKV